MIRNKTVGAAASHTFAVFVAQFASLTRKKAYSPVVKVTHVHINATFQIKNMMLVG